MATLSTYSSFSNITSNILSHFYPIAYLYEKDIKTSVSEHFEKFE